MSELVFFKKGDGWSKRSDIDGLVSFDLVKLRILLMEVVSTLDEIIDAGSAEGQLKFEVARRVRNLASRAQAAGAMSDMWNNQQSRFYKERVTIERLLHEPASHE